MLDQIEMLSAKLKEVNLMHEKKQEKMLARVDELNNELFMKSNEINDLTSAKSGLQEALAKLQLESEQDVEKINELDSRAKNQKQEHSKETQSYANYIDELKDSIQSLERLLEEKHNTLDQIESDLNKQKSETKKQATEIDCFNTKLLKLTEELDRQREENLELRNVNSNFKTELKDLQQFFENHKATPPADKLLKLKMEEFDIQLKISQKENYHIRRELDSLADENSKLKADLQTAHDLIQLQEHRQKELVHSSEQRQQSQCQKFNHKINDLQKEINKLNNHLNESYDFLLEKENSQKETEEDLNTFSRCLTSITEQFNSNYYVENFKFSPGMKVKSKLLVNCLERAKNGFETLSNRLRLAERNKISVIALPTNSSYRFENIKQVSQVSPSNMQLDNAQN